MNVLIARIRVPLVLLAGLLILASTLTDLDVLFYPGLGLLLVGLACYFVLGRVRGTPVPLRLPVRGRWVAVNSPANRVPSHGLHAYGQSYAIDLVYEPADGTRPKFGSDLGFRESSEFPAFGQPILAPADGVVVRVRDRARDHRARNSAPAIVYLLVEGAIQELLGPGRILGNHMVLDIGDGVYVALAHLRQGSALAAEGDTVRAGQHIAYCGNSGNTTEPHLHLQVMDHPRVIVAAGLPMVFTDFDAVGSASTGAGGGGVAEVGRGGTGTGGVGAGDGGAGGVEASGVGAGDASAGDGGAGATGDTGQTRGGLPRNGRPFTVPETVVVSD